MVDPPEHFSFRLAWSRFRRRHQAVARRCRAARRSSSHPVPGSFCPVVMTRSAPLTLTDERWAQVAPLLPLPDTEIGRPPLDHRVMVEGMLWVMGRGASWRELPEQFGKWNTVYCRYRKWRKEGIWQRILDVMNADHHD